MKRSTKPGTSSFGGFNSSPSGAGAFGVSKSATLSYITPPPDLSRIPQEVVVPFKNLLKKDSITKAKALDDIVSYVRGYDGDLEEQVLEAWANLYARISIDNSRRVRELSHILLFELLKSARKRMEKRVPFMVGPWLAGTFDRDKAVSRAAADALSSLLDTKEKQNKFWVKCKTQIFQFATDAILETPDTLSDERSSTKEDSISKYYRVMGGSLSLVLGLLQRLEPAEIEQKLSGYLAVEAVWSMAAAEEAHVRKALYQLIYILLARKPEILRPRLSQIGRILVADSLKSAQSGSATDLVRVLTKLTETYPQVWGTKTHPLQRLRVFVEKGSQGGSGDYWQALDQLLDILPEKAVPLETATAFLRAMRAGIANRQELRTNASQAWETYLKAFNRFMDSSQPNVAFVEENLYPLVRHYLRPSPDSHAWTAPVATATSPRPWIIVSSHKDSAINTSAAEEWVRLGESLSSTLSNSLPEVSKDYQKSQQTVAAEGERWFTLVSAITNGLSSDSKSSLSLKETITTASSQILDRAQDLLSRRNYKPFGAASVVHAAFSKFPSLCSRDELIQSLFPTGNSEQLQLLVTSPSFPFLVRCLDEALAITQGQSQEIWLSLVSSALQCEPGRAAAAINLLLPVSSAASIIRRHDELQTFLASNWLSCAKDGGSTSEWDLCETSLAPGLIPDDRLAAVLSDIIEQLQVSSQAAPALRALELITVSRPTLASQHEQAHVDLVTKLLGLTELQDRSIAEKAALLQATLDHKSTGQRPLVAIIQRDLQDAKSSSLGVDILVQKALSTIKSGDVAMEALFPSPDAWLRELKPFLTDAPDPSLSLTNAVGGAYLLVKEGLDAPVPNHRRDAKGRSIPARMGIYTANIFSSGATVSTLPEDLRRKLIYLISFTAELAADQLTLGAERGLWSPLGEDSLVELEDFTTLSRKILNEMVSNASDWRERGFSGSSLAAQVAEFTLQHSQGLTTVSLYSAKVLCSLLQSLVEAHGPPARLEQWFAEKGVLKATPATVMSAVACLVGFGEVLASSNAAKTLCNRLASEIVGTSAGLDKTLHQVVLFNVAAAVYETGQLPVDNRKQTLALKQLTLWTDSPDEVSPQLAAELCKGIQRILPTVMNIYGPYWQQSIDYCLLLWRKAPQDTPANRFPYVHASLKLMWAFMDIVTSDDASDDLKDVVQEKRDEIFDALIGLLKCPAVLTQPGQIVDALLSRFIDKIGAKTSKLDDLYGLVASPSRNIQKAAFGILHRALPELSEQLLLDTFLGDKDAALPAELISLLLNPPTLEAFPEEVLIEFPTPVRSYLLAWHLIFDAYSKSPFKIRTDYSESLKKLNLVQPFFDFMFDVLGHSASNPLNLDKEGFTEDHVRSYDIKLADAETDERNMHWLLIHLFFSTLRYIPGLFRSWYLESRDKQTKNCLLDWLTRFFSPYIVSGALDEVVEWAEKQEVADDEQELMIKVSRPAREITAAYEIDDETASVLFKIPPAYPLESVEVIGVKRVAVEEKKWDSWLLSVRGAIQFGNGGIIDGLSIFRQNLIRTLKGQTECAICYSIVSSDKKLPDKECGTCRHSFHRICLFKWFQNSGRNSCPLCRNPIELTAGDGKRRK